MNITPLLVHLSILLLSSHDCAMVVHAISSLSLSRWYQNVSCVYIFRFARGEAHPRGD